MAASSFDFLSTSPDGPTYLNGQRGPYATTSMERSGSFRDVVDNRIPSPLTSMPRSTSIPSQAEATNLCQSLISDLKVSVLDNKSPRPGELKREISSIFGISSAESLPTTFSTRRLPSSSIEEIKRMKDNLHESSVKARNRVKAFNDAALKIEKHYHNLSRKRSRLDISSSERSMALAPGGNISKANPQGRPTSSFELGPLKSDERTKSALSNRRMRTSLVKDARDNGIGRSSGAMDRDKDVSKFANGGSALSEEQARALSCAEGLEKSKMKKKRSVIKSDISTSAVLARPPNGDCEPKRGTQQKLDGRPRMNNHAFRSSECEENCGCSPTSNPKVPPRGPRSNSGSLSKASGNFPQTLRNSDSWEHPQGISKLNSVNGATNRKRSLNERSSSPPVVQWVVQRPQKLLRGSRRSNLSPLTSSYQETPSSDTVDDSISNEDSSGFTRRISSNTMQQVKSRGDRTPMGELSESEETGVAYNKPKDKIKKSEAEENVGQTLQKVATLTSPSKKKKLAAHKDLGYGVRRQGRIVRGLTSVGSGTRALNEKVDNAATLSRPRSLKVGSERIESKPGRPPTKKFSEQRGRPHPRHLMNNTSAELSGKPIDDHEVLLTAANAALDTRGACPSTFWKKIEPVFHLLSLEDIAFLNEQIHLIDNSTPGGHVIGADVQSFKGDLKNVSLPSTPANRDGYGAATNGISFNESEKDLGLVWQEEQVEPFLEKLLGGIGTQRGISICQTLLSAIIEEDELDNINYDNSKGEVSFFNTCGSYLEVEVETKQKGLNLQSSRTMEAAKRGAANGFKVNAVWRCHDELAHQKLGSNGVLLESSTLCTEFQYSQMCINDRILLELSEIGLYPDPVPDLAQIEDEDISGGIDKLEEKLHEQVLKKKSILGKLEKAVVEARVSQQRELEYIAFHRLVSIAYEKYMAYWGPNVSGSKNVNEHSKHAVLAFVRQTLARCKKFEQTGISCFSDPAFGDIFISISSHCSDTECTDFSGDGELANHYTVPHWQNNFPDCNPSLTSKTHQRIANDDKYSDVFPSFNQLSEETLYKEEPWSNKIKKRELLLDNVVGNSAHCSFQAPAAFGNSLVNGTKGKRSERDREGKVQNKDAAIKNSSSRIGRPALFNLKGERKNKTKPKQKMTQLSASINGPSCKAADASSTELTSTKPLEVVGGSTKKDDPALRSHSLRMQDKSNDGEAMDLSNLQLPELDVGDFGGNGQDLGSWLNIDEDALQDNDFMGLQIPMDDLSEVNMML